MNESSLTNCEGSGTTSSPSIFHPKTCLTPNTWNLWLPEVAKEITQAYHWLQRWWVLLFPMSLLVLQVEKHMLVSCFSSQFSLMEKVGNDGQNSGVSNPGPFTYCQGMTARACQRLVFSFPSDNHVINITNAPDWHISFQVLPNHDLPMVVGVSPDTCHLLH